MEEMDQLALQTIRRAVLSEAALDYVVSRAAALIQERHEPSSDAHGDLAAQAAKLKKEMDTLARRAANPSIPEEAATQLFSAISERKVQLQRLEREIARLNVPPVEKHDLQTLASSLRASMREFEALMLADVTDARKALAALLGEHKLEFFPTERSGKPTLGFRGKVAATSFFLAANHIGMASPRGFEPRLPP